MKNTIKTIWSLCIVLISFNGMAQQADHQLIGDKVTFFFFNTDTTSNPALIDNDAVLNQTESGGFWADSSLAFFHQFVRALLRAPDNGGDRLLQYYTAKQIKINNRPIAVFLWNDVSSFSVSNVTFGNTPCDDGSGAVWPCASHWTTSENASWGGYMHIGLKNVLPSHRGLSWLNETFLHELMHTQDKTLQLGNSFVVLGRTYRYGADGTHFDIEATPNKRLAYMEAIANVAPMFYNFQDFVQYFDWFNRNGNIMIERNAPAGWIRWMGQLFGAGYNDNIWLYDEISAVSGPGTQDSSRPAYSLYRIQDLPAKFIVHNEIIMAMMMTMTSMHIAEIDPFIWACETFNSRIVSDQNKDPWALFVGIFAEGLLMEGGDSVAEIKRELDSRNYSISPEDDVPYAFVLPLAYSDYFTAYTSTTKNDFKELFKNEMDTDLIDIYWDHFRERVRSNVPIVSGRNWSDMTDIAMQCGINQSYLPGASGRVFDRN